LKNILLTGKPGIGKTTIIKKILKKLKNECGGFYTEEIREKGERKGFKIITLDGREDILAHINFDTEYKVGKYKVNILAFEKTALPSIEDAIKNKKFIIIDEIGKMELFSKKFIDVLFKALQSNKIVIGVIKQKDTPLTRKIKRRSDTKIYQVDEENRDILPELIIESFAKV
jgi:nucleoside-triphosphatase